MKRFGRNAVVVLSVMLLAAILVVPALAGDHGSCGSKMKAASAKSCGDCSACPMPECCGACDGASCDWDNSHWKGVKYDADGHVKGNLSERQAEKIAVQYLKKASGTKGSVVSVKDNPRCYHVSIQPRNSADPKTIVISKESARVKSRA